MSPDEVNSIVKRKQWMTIIMSVVASLIVAFTMRAVGMSDAEKKDMQTKLDEKIDKTEAVGYVNDKIREHEKVDAARYQGIKDMFVITSAQLKEIKEDIREIRKNQK